VTGCEVHLTTWSSRTVEYVERCCLMHAVLQLHAQAISISEGALYMLSADLEVMRGDETVSSRFIVHFAYGRCLMTGVSLEGERLIS